MRPTHKSIIGTSFHGNTISCNYKLLCQILGEPMYNDNDGMDKINMEWVMETEKGDVFTVYDYKYYRPLTEDEQVKWHIGANSPEIADQATDELVAAASALGNRLGNSGSW